MARENGYTAVTDGMMDEAKDKFEQFMGGSTMGM